MNITRFVTRGVIPLSALALLSTALVMGVDRASVDAVDPVDTGSTPAVVRDHVVPRTMPADRVRVTPQQHDHPDETVHGADVDTVVAELPETTVDPFSMLGVTWKSGLVGADTVVQARWRADGTWTGWSELDIEPYEQGTPGTEPLWVGRADAAAIRIISSSGAEPVGVALSTIDPGTTPTLTNAAETVASAGGVPQPTVISRSQWGAKEGSSCDSPIYGSSTKGVVVHHTAGSNSYSKSQSASIVKATQAYHTNSRNWCDIGYNFLVDKYGQIFEGRKGGITKSVRAAHSGNGTVNEQTAGISLMGTFETTSPTSEMKAALVKLAAWKLALHGDPAQGTYSIGGVTLNRIAGHRNVVSTACPGAKVYSWLTSTASTGLRSEVEKAMEEGGSAEPLPTPTGLTVTGQTLSSVSLDWADVDGAEKYHVKASTSSSMSSPTFGKFTESKGTVTGLTPGKKYYFSVVVVDPDRNVRLSEYSGAPYPTAETPAGTTPTGLRATSATSTSLSFDWDDVVGAEKYHVKVSTSSTLSSPTFGKFTESKGTVTGLTPGKKYYFAVVVVDPERNVRLSDYTKAPYPSEVLPLKDPAAGKMSTPTGLEATSATSTSLSFDWDDVVGAEKYHVKVSTSSTLSSPTFGKFTESKGTVTGLTPGKKYYFAVVVVDPERNVRLSDYTKAPYPSEVLPLKDPAAGKMSTPTGLTVTSATPTSLSFDWNDVVGAEKYHVKVSTSSTLSPPTFGKFTESKGTVTGLTPGTKYYFAVVVVDPERNVRLSDYTKAPYPSAVTSTGKLPTPTGLTVTSTTPTTLSFDWNDVAGAEKYHVKVSTSSTLSPPTFGKFTESKGTVTGLTPGTKYYFAVVVVDPERNVRLSDYTKAPYPSAVTSTGKLPTPTGLKATSATPTSLSFDWDDVAGAEKYHVKLSTSSTLSSPTFGKFTESKGTVTGLTPGKKYYFAVVVVDPERNVRLSDYTKSPYPSRSTSSSSAGNTVTVPSSRTISFEGHGYGHGTGMSQYGAEGAAQDGEKYTAILSHYYPGTELSTKSGDIRVLISADTTDGVLVKAESGLKLHDISGKRTIALPTTIGGKAVDRWHIIRTDSSASRSKLQYRTTGSYTNYIYGGSALTWSGDGQFTGPSTISLILPSGSTMNLRGDVRSAKPSSGSGSRNTVNVLPIEDYVRGVIAAEMPNSWHAEALKAQAVAARTYGVRSMSSSRYYDICSTTACQVYGGQSRETSSTDSAVKGTAGKILTYQDSPAFTQFSSSSGGYTNTGSQPYLKAVSDPWDDWSGNKNHSWTISVSASKIEKAYSSIGTLKSMQVTKRNGLGDMGGRVSSLKLVGSKSTKTISGTDARWAFGLRSDWFGF